MKKGITSIFIVLCLMLSMSISVFADEQTIPFSGGDGTKENPYIVATAEDFNNVKQYPNKNFKQVCNISLADYPNIEPIGPSSSNKFSGSYDGGGFEISDISINVKDQEYVGLFGYSSGTIKNIKIRNCELTAYGTTNIHAGSVAGYNNGTERK